MSNSDNVLRGGLLPKHVDVEELMKHIAFEKVVPEIMEGELHGAERKYVCPIPDFSMSTIDLASGDTITYTADGPEILLVLDGEGNAESDQSTS
jgi:mannose-6-phosphate isomerase